MLRQIIFTFSLMRSWKLQREPLLGVFFNGELHKENSHYSSLWWHGYLKQTGNYIWSPHIWHPHVFCMQWISFIANRSSIGLGGMIPVETFLPESRRWGSVCYSTKVNKEGMTFENDFSGSLRKCVCDCAKSRASVSERDGLPQGGGRMGVRKI